MKFGIISDSHDNIWNLEKAIGKLKDLKIDGLMHAGDLCSPFIVAELEKVGVPTHVVFGNTDDKIMNPKLCSESEYITHHGDICEIELDEIKIAMTHLPNFADDLVATGKYDLVIHGHTHKKREEKIKNTIILNPGEIMGRIGTPSFAVFDTKTKKVEFFEF